jgi:hypothetical protein
MQNIADYHVQHADRGLQLDAPELPHYAGKQPFGNRLIGPHGDNRPPRLLDSYGGGQYAHWLNQFLPYELIGLFTSIAFHGDDSATIVDYINFTPDGTDYTNKVSLLDGHITSLLC